MTPFGSGYRSNPFATENSPDSTGVSARVNRTLTCFVPFYFRVRVLSGMTLEHFFPDLNCRPLPIRCVPGICTCVVPLAVSRLLIRHDSRIFCFCSDLRQSSYLVPSVFTPLDIGQYSRLLFFFAVLKSLRTKTSRQQKNIGASTSYQVWLLSLSFCDFEVMSSCTSLPHGSTRIHFP